MNTAQETVERALAASRSDGCVVVVRETSSVNLRWAGSSLTTDGARHGRDLTVVAIVGTQVGVVTGSGVPAEEIEDLVHAADAAARESRPAQDAAPLVDARTSADWTDPPDPTSLAVFEGVAPALGAAFDRTDEAGHSLYGYAEHDVTTTYLATSTGLRLRDAQPTGRLELSARDRDGRRAAWVGRSTRDFADIDVAALGDTLDRRMAWARRRVDLEPGRYDTVLPPSAVADLMISLYWRAGARDAYEGRTVFGRAGGGTRVGEQLTDVPLRLWSDPSLPGHERAPYVVATSSSELSSVFDNGLPVAATDWIAQGHLNALLQTRYSAGLTGLPVTPFIANLALELPGATATVEDLVASTGRGLLLTCLWYIREVDPQTMLLTGLTRDGVYLVEDGEVVAAVNNFRFNESPVDLLRRLAEVGQAQTTFPRELGDYFNGVVMPPVRVPDFRMSTVSQAS